MKSKKLSLQQLSVSSFTTTLSTKSAQTAKGGETEFGCNQDSLTCEPFTAGHCPFQNNYTFGFTECETCQ